MDRMMSGRNSAIVRIYGLTMLQDIFPKKLDLTFKETAPVADDYLLLFNEGRILLPVEGDAPQMPRYEQAAGFISSGASPKHLFSIDGRAFFMADGRPEPPPGFAAYDMQVFRSLKPSWLAFAGATAAHLAAWYTRNRFCGHCAGQLTGSHTERALACPNCGLIIYPGIAPVVIVGLIDGERLLMTRYAAGVYRRPALIAGFVEVGETFEDAVRREVFEEVGLKVKNIRYYRSQPWAFSQSILAGFYADLDGSDQVTVDHQELSEAFWVKRADLPRDDSNISLTYEMIDVFRSGRLES